MANPMIDENVPLKEQRMFEAMRRYVLPALGVVETIVSKGKSPGTMAMTAEQNFQQQEDRRRQWKKDEDERQGAALERALKTAQKELYGEQLAGAKEERARTGKLSQEFESSLESDPELSAYERALRKGAGAKSVYEATGRERQLGERLSQSEELARMRDQTQRDLREQSNLNAILLAGQNRAFQEKMIDKKIAGKAGTTDSKVERIYDVIGRIDEISTHPGLGGAVGMKGAGQLFGLKKEPIAGTDEASFNETLAALKGLLTIENMGLMKGVLSDSDIKIITSAATSLSPKMKEIDFKRELSRIKNKMELAKGKIESGTASEESAGSSWIESDADATPAKSYLDEIRARKAARGQK